MSSVIHWSSLDSDANSEDNFKKIARWLAKLHGETVKYYRVDGYQTNESPEEEKVLKTSNHDHFKILNPRLEDAHLCYETPDGVQKILVQKLKLDIEQKQLKVFSTDPHRHYFTWLPTSSGGLLSRETIF
jgi:hypothetical protein